MDDEYKSNTSNMVRSSSSAVVVYGSKYSEFRINSSYKLCNDKHDTLSAL